MLDQRTIKKYIKTMFRVIGLDVKPYTFHNVDSVLISKCLDFLKIDLLIDVGANEGQFGKVVRREGYKNSICSFEPIQSAFKTLAINAQKDRNWDVYNFAIGNGNHQIQINISENIVSSSILQITNVSTQAEPKTAYKSTEEVEMVTLDSFFNEYDIKQKNLYLKIDVQGFEMEVLKGAISLLKKVRAVQLEMSLVELYKGSPLFFDMISYLKDLGFELYSIMPEFKDPENGRLLQVDGIFIRKI